MNERPCESMTTVSFFGDAGTGLTCCLPFGHDTDHKWDPEDDRNFIVTWPLNRCIEKFWTDITSEGKRCVLEAGHDSKHLVLLDDEGTRGELTWPIE